MSPFQEAMRGFVRATLAVNAQHESDQWIPPDIRAEADRDLASAGDRLESELRRMMREEAMVQAVLLAQEED